MFYYLKGSVAARGENFIAIDVGGAGYKVYTSMNTLSKSELGQEITVFTYVHIREDILDIYGFATAEELSFFELLISISGVGPKAALSILSVLSPSDLAAALITDDVKSITRAQGVGAKLAQRIILELKSKVSDYDLLADVSAKGGEDFLSISSSNEAVSALLSLGYSSQEARRAVAMVEGAQTTEETVKEALKKLMR